MKRCKVIQQKTHYYNPCTGRVKVLVMAVKPLLSISIILTILRRFSWPSLAYMFRWPKPDSFHFISFQNHNISIQMKQKALSKPFIMISNLKKNLCSPWLIQHYFRVARDKICKRCSFECDMGKYSTRSMNKV